MNKLTLLCMGAALALVGAAMTSSAESSRDAAAIVLEGPATVLTPGDAVPVPAQSQVKACRDENNIELIYHPASRTLVVPNPCNDLFSDGFE